MILRTSRIGGIRHDWNGVRIAVRFGGAKLPSATALAALAARAYDSSLLVGNLAFEAAAYHPIVRMPIDGHPVFVGTLKNPAHLPEGIDAGRRQGQCEPVPLPVNSTRSVASLEGIADLH